MTKLHSALIAAALGATPPTRVVPKCSRSICKAPATVVPVVQLHAPIMFQDAKPVEVVMGLPLCDVHKIDLAEACRIVKIESLATAVEQQGKVRPDTSRTTLIHIPVSDKRYQKLIMQRQASQPK